MEPRRAGAERIAGLMRQGDGCVQRPTADTPGEFLITVGRIDAEKARRKPAFRSRRAILSRRRGFISHFRNPK
jgi:hypothetical protein